MGIADGIDRLLRTLRPAAAAPATRASAPPAGLPAVPSGNGRDPVPTERAPNGPPTVGPGSAPASEESVTQSVDTLTGALTARVEQAYQSHRETAVTDEPAGAGAVAPDGDTADALAATEPEHASVEPPEQVEQAPPAEPASVGEPAVAADPPERDVVVLPPVVDDVEASRGEVVLGPEPPPLPATTQALRADSLARLEAASGIAESLGLGFHLGGAVERIAYGASRGREGVDALREATWLIERYVALVEQRPIGADLHASAVRLGRTGDAIAEIHALTAALDASRDARLAALGGADPRSPTRRDAGHTGPGDPGGSGGAAINAPNGTGEHASGPPQEPARESFGREVALMATRWAIMVVAVIAVVLAVTMIGEWV